MVVDERLERLYRQVELVRGAGEPRSRKLCVMSFVAFLAGEAHSDRPLAASPLIRELAVRINDTMPQEMRQKLKPFVPRILGTNDGCDGQRAAMLRVVAESEIVPRVFRDFMVSRGGRMWRRTGRFPGLSEKLLALTTCFNNPAGTRPDASVGAAVADLLCYCAATAPGVDSRRWYWEKSIDVLDCLCDVRRENASRTIDEARLRRLEDILAGGHPFRRHTAMARSVAGRLRFLLARAW